MVKNLKKIEYLVLVVVWLVFVIAAGKYFYIKLIPALSAGIDYARAYINNRDCPRDQIRVIVEDGFLCRDAAQPSVWLDIYDTYPKSAGGKEVVYSFLNQGDLEIANQYLDNWHHAERFEPVKIEPPITWQEDPYNERYWRFHFYSLRSTRHLLYAGSRTGQPVYFNKLLEIIESFIDQGMNRAQSWNDYHAVAFRTMVLTNTWWKLRQNNALPIETSTKILKTLQIHGDFLMDPEHYQPGHNHGLNQAIALLNLAFSFPDLSGSDQWLAIAQQRFSKGLNTLIDADGILIENSPYYHFYVLQKYWEFYKYSQRYLMDVDPVLDNKIKKMISYATYILQPDSGVPLIGASLKNTINLNNEFADMAQLDPYLLYVLSHGQQGEVPGKKNQYYPAGGQVIMRSGWGKGDDFLRQTHLIFDVGPYRTTHSDYDAFSFDLYSHGQYLINDPGLYTYEEGDYRNYFDSTAAHNTVVVDGLNQLRGSPTVIEFVEDENYTYLTAKHDLYPQVIHYRTMALLGRDLVLIIDYLVSEREHDYKQMFHLFPEAELQIDDLTVRVRGKEEKQLMTIHQLAPEGMNLEYVKGQESPPAGLCSHEYESLIPCYSAGYQKLGKNVRFITLLEIGESNNLAAKINPDQDNLHIKVKHKEYTINLVQLKEFEGQNNKIKPIEYKKETNRQLNLQLWLNNNNWQMRSLSGPAPPVDYQLTQTAQHQVAIKNMSDQVPEFEINIEGLGEYYRIDDMVATPIPINPNQDEFNIYQQEDFVPILGYHNVLDDDQKIDHPSLEIHLSDFTRQVNYATKVLGCRWYTFADIMENYVLPGKKTPQRACVMNFDDGYRDNYENALPVLDKYDIKATFYIIPGLLESNRYMTRQQVDELYRQGHEIGSHTIDSGGLVSAGWNQDELIYQIQESKNILNARGYNVKTFAYPHGESSQRIVEIVKDSGYIAARDISKPNTWRDRRPQTVSMNDGFRWHMYYHKPEQETPQQLGTAVGYNTWWQFEEGFLISSDNDNDVRTLSSIKPAPTSYASVTLPDTDDSITNNFIISEQAEYNIHIYAAIESQKKVNYNPGTTNLKVLVDGILRTVIDGQECTGFDKWLFCDYYVKINLAKGKHTLSISPIRDRLMLDKFRIYRTFARQNLYNLTITEYRKTEVENDDQHQNKTIISSIAIHNTNPPRMYILILNGLLVLILFYQIFKTGVKKRLINKTCRVINLANKIEPADSFAPNPSGKADKRIIAALSIIIIATGLYWLKAQQENRVRQERQLIATETTRTNKKTYLFDSFDNQGVLEEVSRMDQSSSADWWLNSGGLFVMSNGVGKTLQGEQPELSKWRLDYANYNPASTNDGFHPQNIFRLITRHKWRDSRQETYFRILKNNLSSGKHRNESNGVLLLSRYLDSDNLYYAGLRVDGTAVIKKKIQAEYFTLAQKSFFEGREYNRHENPNLIPKNQWLGIRSEVINSNDNKIKIKLFIDTGQTGDWEMVLEAVDDGINYGGESILDKGYAGIRTDFMDVEFDNYRINPY